MYNEQEVKEYAQRCEKVKSWYDSLTYDELTSIINKYFTLPIQGLNNKDISTLYGYVVENKKVDTLEFSIESDTFEGQYTRAPKGYPYLVDISSYWTSMISGGRYYVLSYNIRVNKTSEIENPDNGLVVFFKNKMDRDKFKDRFDHKLFSLLTEKDLCKYLSKKAIYVYPNSFSTILKNAEYSIVNHKIVLDTNKK